MGNEILLSPEELYFLGGQMQAKYIDYAYVSEMGDIQQNYCLYESTVKAELTKKGMIEEDFSGNLIVADFVKEILHPIFFGKFESSLDICKTGDESYVQTIKIHACRDCFAMVEKQDGQWRIASCGREEIIRWAKDVYPNIDDGTVLRGEPFVQDGVDYIFIVKNTVIGKESNVRIVFQIGTALYEEDESGEIQEALVSAVSDRTGKELTGGIFLTEEESENGLS